MTYQKAISILGFNQGNAIGYNAMLAESLQGCLAQTAPLKIKVACNTIIKLVEEK